MMSPAANDNWPFASDKLPDLLDAVNSVGKTWETNITETATRNFQHNIGNLILNFYGGSTKRFPYKKKGRI